MVIKRVFPVRISVISLTIAIVMGALFAGVATVKAAHVPEHYSVTYTDTNFYNITPVSWFFSDLDSGTSYQFRLEHLNIDTGAVKDTLKTWNITGVTSATLTADAGTFPDLTIAPARLVDQFDHVVSYHFFAPTPSITAWTSDQGPHANILDRTAIASAPYLVPNELGQFHDPIRPVFSTTGLNETTILHYQIPAATTTEDEVIVFKSMLDGVTLATFSLDEMLRYNHPSCNVDCLSGDPIADLFALQSFVVITTNNVGQSRPWYINDEAANNAYGGVFNIPHRMDVDFGVYDYAKLSAIGELVALGETPWIVSSIALSPDEVAGDAIPRLEWDLSVLSERVQINQNQRAFVRAQTEEVWAAVVDQTLTDTALPDDNDISEGLLRSQYLSNRQIRWNVSDEHIGTQTITWSLAPTLQNWATTTVDYTWSISTTYQTTLDATLTQSTLNFLDNWNLATPFGILGIMTIGLLVLFAMFKRSAPPILYGVTYGAVVTLVVMSSLLPLGYDVLLSVSAVLAIPATLKMNSNGGGD